MAGHDILNMDNVLFYECTVPPAKDLLLQFFLLQAVLPSLQAMLIGDAAAATLWIGLFDDDMNTWYLAVLGQQNLPAHWFLFAALSIVASFIVSFAVFKVLIVKSA